MSSSNASAIRRRVGTPTVATQNQPASNATDKSQNTPQNTPNQMTLQQVISTIDKRLTQLETIATTTNNNNNNNNNDSSDLPVIVDEFNSRFELIVNEINSLKDVVMKLQSYTMEINKMLVEERIRILSDLDNHTVSSSTVNTKLDAESLTSADLKSMVQQELNNENK